MDAERLHLQALVKQRAHEIEWQECQIFIENIRKLGTMGTYLTGIAFTALYMTNIYVHDVADMLYDLPNGTSSPLGFRNYGSIAEIVSGAVSACAIGLCVTLVAIANWCSIFGSDLALRGQKTGDMTRALTGMYLERKVCIRLFFAAVAATMCQAVTIGWLRCEGKVAYIFVIVIPAFMVFIYAYMRFRVRERFKFPKKVKSRRPEVWLLKDGYNPEHMMVNTSIDRSEGKNSDRSDILYPDGLMHLAYPSQHDPEVDELRVGSGNSSISWGSGLSNLLVPSMGSVSGTDLTSMLQDDIESQHLPLIEESSREMGSEKRRRKKKTLSYMMYHPTLPWGGGSTASKPAYEYLEEQKQIARAAGESYAAQRAHSPPRSRPPRLPSPRASAAPPPPWVEGGLTEHGTELGQGPGSANARGWWW